jgi:cytoskeleton protein RodZ
MTDNEATPQSITLGEALKKARVQQDYTKEAMADVMKLTVDKVTAIESYRDLASLSPFDRGYVRNYASKVGLSLEPFELQSSDVAKLAAELQPIAKEDWSKPLFPWIRVAVWVVIVGLLFTGIVGYFFSYF